MNPIDSEFYALVAKWHDVPPLGFEFVHKAKNYRIIGIVRAGNKLRAECSEDGKVYLFPTKGFCRKYKAPRA